MLYEDLVAKYQRKGILVDTNILLLYMVGRTNRDRIQTFQRTEKYLPEDYDLLLEFLAYFEQVITTPNILTEVNSLANQLGEPDRSCCFLLFSQEVALFEEHCIESKMVVTSEKFTKFGLTDCGILSLVKGNYLVLSDDFKLTNYLQSQDIDVINFNHIRPLGWR